ncbi:protein FAM131C-like [Lepus europaeus]|uniref:protein FAM131C-like n=1 Tax=Lepus europaeus TaxID=9983 RepID=UPI002B47D511|nr:protein FAM131C-like [Lepus europaeus]
MDLFTSAHKDCPMPQGTETLDPHLCEGRPPATAPDHVAGQDKQMDFCWDPWQRCFQTTNGHLCHSRSCASNYNVAALATSSLVGVVQSIKDHMTKPTAMARGRVAHLIEWKGWSAQRSGWELSPAEDERYHCLPDELREARFAAGVAEQFAITEATLSAWSSLDGEELHLLGTSPQDTDQLQGTARGPGLGPQHPSPEQQHPGDLGPMAGGCLQGSLPSVDSGSLSEEEDEVFYN